MESKPDLSNKVRHNATSALTSYTCRPEDVDLSKLLHPPRPFALRAMVSCSADAAGVTEDWAWEEHQHY